MRKTVVLVLLLFFIFSCSKSNDSSGITGTWIFTGSNGFAYSYPSVINNSQTALVSMSALAISSDSIKINFDKEGNYTFLNLRLPADNGKYTIAQDSFLIIKPDTADFVKFNYPANGSLISGTDTMVTIPPAPTPYANFKYISDTILFRKTGNNNITFSTLYITKASQPVLLTGDTLLLNQNISYYKRQ